MKLTVARVTGNKGSVVISRIADKLTVLFVEVETPPYGPTHSNIAIYENCVDDNTVWTLASFIQTTIDGYVGTGSDIGEYATLIRSMQI